MSTLILVSRIVHIGLGVFWAGSLVFMAVFLEPSVRGAGPDGAKVMQQLMKRNLLNVMPVVALLTIISGIMLYWKIDSSFRLWMSSAYHFALAAGGVIAIVAFVIGVFIMRPAVLRAGAIAQAAMQLPEGAEREGKMAAVMALRRRSAVAGRVVAALLSITVITMAVARYV
ncbi:MAG TPA: hypothetical protein VNL18_12145 [Gemmatimonadales bacterium]|nr:hypothetical protein [Gemmatimonadales bacterium]